MNTFSSEMVASGVDSILVDQPSEEIMPSDVHCEFINVSDWFIKPCNENGPTFAELAQKGKAIETIWVIPTSGTTGIPKLISHTLSSLSRTVKRNVDLGSNYSWGLMYQLARFAGLQVFLQSFISGSKLIFIDMESTPVLIIDQLKHGNCNALSATPTMFRKLLMGGNLSGLPLKQITLGGEIADQNILDAVKFKFPEARLSHVYASTETGVGFTVTDGLAGFPESYLESSVSGVAIKISDDGILMLRNNKVAQANIDRSIYAENNCGYVSTGDLVSYKGNRYQFMGRSNSTINIGGNKVQPEEIERIIQCLDEVELVSVSAKKSMITGELVVATVVPSSIDIDVNQLKQLILQKCRERLSDFKVPAIIRIVDDIEANHSGKIKRDLI